jgi:hypothetical protein
VLIFSFPRAQSAGALQRRLDDEERNMGELQRDKERYDQRRQLENKVRAVPIPGHMFV